ncbi:MAG: sigma-54 interaction domain-containing protein [Planctomycetota bacterium]
MIGTEKRSAHSARLIAASEAMRNVVRLADNVAPSDCPVLIEGESGTGKELVARRICANSRRWNKPFIPVNCAGISESLFESQFFGHVRGAFTGAEQSMLGLVRTADSGTLFLDEVGEIPLSQQAKLLRVLQEQEVMPVGNSSPLKVNTRFLAGTNRSLAELVRRGLFRNDLFYRLNIVRIVVPPLRDRREDVSALLDHFSAGCAERYGIAPIPIEDTVRNLLTEYPWPGNVRELAAWVERLYATGLPPEHLVELLLQEASAVTEQTEEPGLSLEQAERRAIVRAMERAEFNQRKAARLLQVHRATLARKLRKHNLS